MSRFRDIIDSDVAFFHFIPPSLRRIDAPSSKLFPANPLDFPARLCFPQLSDSTPESLPLPLEPGLIQNKCDTPVAFRGNVSRFRDAPPCCQSSLGEIEEAERALLREMQRFTLCSPSLDKVAARGSDGPAFLIANSMLPSPVRRRIKLPIVVSELYGPSTTDPAACSYRLSVA
jgi:hypothetical protein